MVCALCPTYFFFAAFNWPIQRSSTGPLVPIAAGQKSARSSHHGNRKQTLNVLIQWGLLAISCNELMG